MSSPETEQYRQFQTVFRTYYNQLCNYALTFTKDEDVCEDIVQDLFIKVWEQRRGLLRETSIRYYLFTAVRNNCISWLRKEKQQGTVRLTSQESPAVTPDYSKETAGGEKDERHLIEQAIARLPPKCKEVFLLSRFGKLSYREIASSLGISEKTVENQLGKALKMLRAFLKESRASLILMIAWIFS
ncbi:MAG TPA: RNA polymerase sigma-70 factor [Puia sp.]